MIVILNRGGFDDEFGGGMARQTIRSGATGFEVSFEDIKDRQPVSRQRILASLCTSLEVSNDGSSHFVKLLFRPERRTAEEEVKGKFFRDQN
jgi:hypothetical protein